MTNRVSSFATPPTPPPLRRYAGKIGSTSELAISAIGDTYLIEGSGSVLSLPNWPLGPPMTFHILANPTFVNSSRLKMPGGENYTCSQGDSIIAMPLGDMVWRVIQVCRADGVPYLPASVTAFTKPQGRMTLTSGTDITGTDVAAATSLYYTPSEGEVIPLWDGRSWVQRVFSETTLSLSGLTAAKNYDLWGRDNNGVLALDTTIWTDDVTRATAITKQHGIDVKSGDPTRRLLGSFRIVATGQTEDSKNKRYVSNRYNDAGRLMQVLESTFTWTWSTASWHQVNASAANQLEMLLTVPRRVQAYATCFASSSASANMATGIGINAVPAATDANMWTGLSTSGAGLPGYAYYDGTLAAGRNYLTWLERGFGTGTQTFQGANLPLLQTGIMGVVNN